MKESKLKRARRNDLRKRLIEWNLENKAKEFDKKTKELVKKFGGKND